MPKTTKTPEKASDATEQVKHSVPMAAGRRPSVIDRQRAKVKPNTKAVKDSDRAVIEIDEETQQKFIDFACSKEIFDLVEAQKTAQSKDVAAAVYEKFVDVLWRSKSQPQNPAIKATSGGRLDAEGQFIVSGGSKIKINMPETMEDEQPEEALVRGLIELGLPQSNAERLVNTEVSFVPQWSLSFTDLMRGEVKSGKINPATPTQMSASEILFCAINGEDLDGNEVDGVGRLKLLSSITADGWFALQTNVKGRTSYFPTLVDGPDFLDRVCNYADSREDLSAILTVFTPVYYCSRVKFAVSDSAEGKKERMLEEAEAIIGAV